MKIYILYTGGRIGAIGGEMPLSGPAFVNSFKHNLEPVIMSVNPGLQIYYDWFDELTNEENMEPVDWVRIAERILDRYDDMDAFIVLHNTDTMAFTSSALSFLLAETDKPVIVTGSQIPLFYDSSNPDNSIMYNTDAFRNILGAIRFSMLSVSEVCIYSDDNLYRANRTVLNKSNRDMGFVSPYYPVLGRYKTEPELDYSLVLNKLPNRDTDTLKREMYNIANNINRSIAIIFRLFPIGIDENGEVLLSLLQNIVEQNDTIKGIVIDSIGVGAIPKNRQFVDFLNKINSKGILVIDCSDSAKTDRRYREDLEAAGVVNVADMTTISAFAKLTVLLAKYPGIHKDKLSELMISNLTGELTHTDRLYGNNNQRLDTGGRLISSNGKYKLINDTKGVITLYNDAGNITDVVWRKDMGQPGYLMMRNDNVLVFCNKKDQVIYSSEEMAYEGYNTYFIVNDNGDLYVCNQNTNEVVFKVNNDVVITI
jgi:L-asparaginase